MEPATIIDEQLREVSMNAQAAHEALTHFLASSDLVGRWVTLEVGEDAERERGRLWDAWEAANEAYRRVTGDDYYPAG